MKVTLDKQGNSVKVIENNEVLTTFNNKSINEVISWLETNIVNVKVEKYISR